MRRLAVTLLVSVLIAACGKLPGYKVNETSQDFTQAGSVNDKVDILFVVDNSGSMSDNQTNLANNFSSFIQQFSTRSLKYQIGVVSTDTFRVSWTSPTNFSHHSSTAGYWNCSSFGNPNDCPYNGISNNGPGSLLHKTGNDRILTPSSANLITQFQQNILLGIKGTGAEQGLISAMLAFTSSLSSGWNANFLRSAAFLAVIMVSDEDEGVSATDSTYIRNVSTAAKNARLDQFETFMKSLKDDDRMVRFDAIVNTTGNSCNDTSQDGKVYEEAATRLNGRILSICDNFGTTMADLGSDILSAITRFKLRQPPQGDITVYVDGALVPNNSVNGWIYLPDTMEIEFRGTGVPSVGQKIQVNYVPGAPA